MKLPNAKAAVVDIRKLRDYSLNPEHGTGKHKARVFLSALGITAKDADALREIILRAVVEYEAELGLKDKYGQRYFVDFFLEWESRQAEIRSTWIIEEHIASPRLTSCYVL